MTITREIVLERLKSIPRMIVEQARRGRVPKLELSTRSKKNILFDPERKVWVYGPRKSVRSLGRKREAMTILRTLYVIGFLTEQVSINKGSTLRELYYISENWGPDVKFDDQNESNKLIEDLEIMLRLLREHFRIYPEEDGASIIGDLLIREPTNRGVRVIHCIDDVGDAGYNIPADVDKIEFLDCGADFVLAIETGGMFMRLREERFDERYNCLLVHLKGQPARSTRRLLKRLNEELGLPVVVFTDGDPWSFRIFASIAYGAIKTAHISDRLATPTAQFVGVRPSDIIKYDLPTDKLTDTDIRALQAELSDPRFSSEFWQREIRLQLELGKKSEQQALARYGLSYVADVYLPERLSEMGII